MVYKWILIRIYIRIVISWTHRVSTVDVPQSPIATGARGPWQQQRCDSLNCNEEWWGSAPPSGPCDYDLFVKIKEPLRGTRYNTRDELIHAIGRSVRNNNKDEGADGVRRLPNIWKKVINKGDDYIRGT